ncbi:MAG: hypothetical protein PHO26_02610 [Dehalococcoidia bacterium]|nr:hypothetical protein [Dehalococcoidia bacterium]MDD5493798.1 hypothetical protein [Dehalococcoidia bacterium]
MLRLCRIASASLIFLVIISVMASCAPSGTAPSAVAPAGNAPAASGGNIDAFRAALQKDDFGLKLAPFLRVDLIRLYQAGRLANAAGNNAGALYRGIFGAIPDNIVIPDVSQLAGASKQVENFLYGMPGLLQGWQINPDEAVVVVAKTPPQCVYFSYCGFIFNKYYEKDGKQKWIWASYNDPLNNLTIKTSGTPNGAKGNPFNQDTIIIITADKGTDRRIRSAAIAAGYSEDIINTYVIPSSMVKLGIGPEYDTVVFGQRITLCADQKAGEEYASTITAALRATPQSGGKLDLFPAPEIKVRGTGKTEVDFQPALDDLRKAILAKYSGLTADELIPNVWLQESYEAVQTETYVAGESRDTVYTRCDTLKLADNPDEFIIVYGVNHAATGKATYANCTFYGEAGWNGVAGIYSTEYEGTAEAYLPGNPMAKYLYVCKFARNCGTEKACVTVPTGPGAFGVELDEPAFIGFRAYLEPATKVGPAYPELLFDRVIKFSAAK